MTPPLPLKSKTLTLPIRATAEKVYAFVSNLVNLPKWAATFVKSIEHTKDGWILQTTQGPLKIRMTEKNKYGITDHYLFPAPGVEIYVPMRVVPNGKTCEVIFTLFQGLGMPDEQFVRDIAMVQKDLSRLKTLMEID